MPTTTTVSTQFNLDRGERPTKSLNLKTLTDVTLNERSDGNGTITFGPTMSAGTWWPASRRHQASR